jgi:hypothetical protein
MVVSSSSYMVWEDSTKRLNGYKQIAYVCFKLCVLLFADHDQEKV